MREEKSLKTIVGKKFCCELQKLTAIEIMENSVSDLEILLGLSVSIKQLVVATNLQSLMIFMIGICIGMY